MATEAARNTMLDAVTIDAIRLHSGDPGAAGTDNALGSGLSPAVFNAAAGGERALNAAVTVTGLSASQPVSHWSYWTTAGSVYVGGGVIDTGDVLANLGGEYTLAVGTKIQLINAT